ncbi:MAG: ATP-dependent DNA helicase [Patescibacteria group bacterium]
MQSINHHTVLIKEKKAGEIAMAFLQDSGYLKFLSEQEEGKVKETMRELNLFKKRMDEFGAESGDASVKNFLTELNLEIESGEGGALLPDVEAGPEMIKILTVHAAKGLEFKYVFIVNMVDLRFPTTERHDPISLPDALVKEIIPAGDAHLEEERRLFYVAMTRAKTGLYFSWAPDYGGTRTKKPSRFLGELGIKNLELRNNEKEKVNFIKKIENVNLNKSKPVYELPKYYSYTQLQAYGNCPYQYRFAHILKIPTPGNYKFSFGQTMHLTLQKFFGLMIQNKNLPQADLFGSNAKIASTLPSQEDLLKLYAESWIDDWYESKAQKEELKAKGKDILKDFYARHKDNWPEVLSLEQGFNLRVGGQPIYGKIDRIDNLGERGIQIVDYKTGRPKEENKITLEEKEQLLIYQLAAEEVMQKKVANLQFYYLDNNSEINFLGTAEEKIKMQEKILAKIQAIETGIKNDDFPAKPSQLCKFCDFRSICEHRQL